MCFMNYIYANSWLPGRNAVVFSCFGACCWSTDDLSTACFSLWCVCCLVGGLLYRSPGATTHTWNDCFSALTRGLWNRSTCILLKNHGSLDKTYTKKSSSGKFVQAKRTQYLMAKACQKDGCQFWFSLISKSHPFFMAFFMACFYGMFPSLARPWRLGPGQIPAIPRHLFDGLERGVAALQFLQRASNIGKVVISSPSRTWDHGGMVEICWNGG